MEKINQIHETNVKNQELPQVMFRLTVKSGMEENGKVILLFNL